MLSVKVLPGSGAPLYSGEGGVSEPFGASPLFGLGGFGVFVSVVIVSGSLLIVAAHTTCSAGSVGHWVISQKRGAGLCAAAHQWQHPAPQPLAHKEKPASEET